MAANQENIEARLCAYVDDELTEQERIEIEAHLAAHPHHRRLLRELSQTRTLLQGLPRAKSPAGLVETFQSQLERTALLVDEESEPTNVVLRINRRTQVYAAAALVLLACGLAVVIYKVLPPSTPNREIVMVSPDPTPGLVTTEDRGAADRPRSESIVGDSRKELARKELASGGLPSGGGGGSGGAARDSKRGSEFVGKGGLALAAKPADAKPLAGPSDLFAARSKMGVADPHGNAANGSINVAGTVANNAASPAQQSINGGLAEAEAPVVVVVNTTNPALANNDVSAYLRDNKIQFSEENEAAAPPYESNVNAAPTAAPSTPAPAAPATAEKAPALKDEAVAQKKLGWYLGSDGQVHIGTADEADAAKAKQAAPGAGVDTTTGQGSEPAKAQIAGGPASQPLRGVELSNGYNSSNPVTYRALMSHRQVLDLNTRLSLREGQSAEIRSDTPGLRPEGYAIGNSLRNGNTTVAAGGETLNKADAQTPAGPDRESLDKASAGRQRTMAPAKGVETGGRADGVAEQTKNAPAANESQSPALTDAARAQQTRTFGGNFQQAQAAKPAANEGTDRRAGEKSASAPASQSQNSASVAQNAASAPSQADSQAINRNGGQQMPLRRTGEPAEPTVAPQQEVSQQSATRQPAPAVASDPVAAQQPAPSGVVQGAKAKQASLVDEDEQPHAVLIVVPGQNPTATTPAAAPSTRPADSRH